MSPKDRKSKQYNPNDDDLEPLFDQGGSRPKAQDARRIRKIHPLGPRVVVRLSPDTNVTDSGLYLPEGAKQASEESVLATVIEVASALDNNEEETNVSGIPLGATVLIPKACGIRVPWDDDLRIIDTREILGLVDEISLT
jgi:co-chaperonin GroES (HSP10)